MNNRGWMALLALGVLVLLAMDSFFIVNQTEKAVPSYQLIRLV